MAKLTSAGPVSDEDTNALPVKNLAGAIAFYENVLGFSVVSRDSCGGDEPRIASSDRHAESSTTQ